MIQIGSRYTFHVHQGKLRFKFSGDVSFILRYDDHGQAMTQVHIRDASKTEKKGVCKCQDGKIQISGLGGNKHGRWHEFDMKKDEIILTLIGDYNATGQKESGCDC